MTAAPRCTCGHAWRRHELYGCRAKGCRCGAYAPPFGGATYDPAEDGARLAAQLTRVREVMADGAWRTLAGLAALTGYPEASISARLRDLRKVAFGGYVVRRERIEHGHGQWRYRVEPPRPIRDPSGPNPPP